MSKGRHPCGVTRKDKKYIRQVSRRVPLKAEVAFKGMHLAGGPDKRIAMVITCKTNLEDITRATGKYLGKAYWYKPKFDFGTNSSSMTWDTRCGAQKVWYTPVGLGSDIRVEMPNGNTEIARLNGLGIVLMWHSHPFWDKIKWNAIQEYGMLWSDKSVFRFIPGTEPKSGPEDLIKSLDMRNRIGGTLRYE